MRFTLWQRIFVYTIMLLIISQLLAFFLLRMVYKEDVRRNFVESSRKMAEDLDGQPLAMTLAHARIYNRGGQQNFWLTNGDGSAIPGMDFTEDVIVQAKVRDRWNRDGVELLEVDKDPKFWGKVPLHLQEGAYWLYTSFGPPPALVRHSMLFQLLAPVLLAGVALALWMGWSVSRPLRRLREELREMSQTGPGCKVTVKGKDEISEVAGAVNSMADSLAKHVQGMHSLVVNVSHELRSPLARANLALGIIEESLPEEFGGSREVPQEEKDAHPESNRQMVVKYLAALQEEMNHMDALIGTTLLSQKLDLQMDATPMEKVDFSMLCRNTWKRHEPGLERSGFSLRAAIAEGATLSGNSLLLTQMLTNLFDNCLKYTMEGGEVRFTLTVRQEKCSLYIENSHDALNEAQVDHIFDPFYRIDQATGTGIGLGLALVQKTVLLHKGEIMAVPTDIGLCICLQLPLLAAEDTA